jgi:beta-RFAP synthase
VAPLLAHCNFPADWRVVLTLPAWAQGLHGRAERQAFRCLQDRDAAPAVTDALCRLVLLGMLPALYERDLPAFGEALFDFNARVGEAFAGVQGGVYAHPRLAEVVSFIRNQDVNGVGQSSWGAAIFAIVADEEQASSLARRVREHFALAAEEVLVTAACNSGATVTHF